MKKLKITLVKSPIACLEKHIRTVEALGLHKPRDPRHDFRREAHGHRGRD